MFLNCNNIQIYIWYLCVMYIINYDVVTVATPPCPNYEQNSTFNFKYYLERLGNESNGKTDKKNARIIITNK